MPRLFRCRQGDEGKRCFVQIRANDKVTQHFLIVTIGLGDLVENARRRTDILNYGSNCDRGAMFDVQGELPLISPSVYYFPLGSFVHALPFGLFKRTKAVGSR